MRKHVIHKKEIILRATDHRMPVLDYSLRISNLLQAQVAEILERLSVGDEHVRINCIEITLSIDDPEDEQGIVQAFTRQFEAKLGKFIGDSERFQTSKRSSSGPKEMAKALLFLLDTGSRPWWSTVSDNWEMVRYWTDNAEGFPNDEVPKMLKLLCEKPAAKQRLVQQFPRKFVDYIITLLEALIEGRGAVSNRKTLVDILGGKPPTAQQLAARLEVVFRRKDTVLTNIDLPPDTEVLSNPERLAALTGAGETNLSLEGAGIVLTHPFLPHLFRGMDLLGEKVWRGTSEQQAAARLVYHLAFGCDAAFFEPYAVLAKLLTGLPLKASIDLQVPLPENWESELNNLLLALVGNWGKIGNTSPVGFRQNFVLRSGVLYAEENAWRLRVEQRSFDILLGSLPWNFGIIKHPWMPKPLYVEWA